MSAIFKNFETNSNREIDRVYHLAFKEQAIYIGKMDTMRKAEMAAEIQPILDQLYATADRYGNPDYPLEDQIGPELFMNIMTKIKRWETIIYWLFEIDIMMGETELDKQVKAAEAKMEKIGWDMKKTHLKVVPNVNGEVSAKSGKVTKNLIIETTYGKEYLDLIEARENRGLHTEEIIESANLMAEAASLTKRFFR